MKAAILQKIVRVAFVLTLMLATVRADFSGASTTPYRQPAANGMLWTDVVQT